MAFGLLRSRQISAIRIAVANLASAALAEFGQIDVCVNNAGVGAIGRFEDIPLKEQAKVIETNLLGTLYGSFHAHRQFQKQGSGILINIASELGRESVPTTQPIRRQNTA